MFTSATSDQTERVFQRYLPHSCPSTVAVIRPLWGTQGVVDYGGLYHNRALYIVNVFTVYRADMDISHSIRIVAPRDKVFALYADPASWPVWDSETVAVHLPSLGEGASGWLKPRQGPKAKIKVTEVTQDRSFTVESALPFCRIQFGHELAGEGSGTHVTHWVRFTGPLAPLFRRLIGNGIDRSLPDTLAGLKRASEYGTVGS